MNRVKIFIVTAIIGLGAAFAFSPTPASALDCAGVDKDKPSCKAAQGLEGAGGGQPGEASLKNAIGTIIDVLLFVLGVAAVIMIIVGGLKYTTSNGDSAAVTSAKNTILYSIVGLIVAILAYAIVKFVLGQF